MRLFNELAVVKVGGKVNINDNIYDYFDGIIAGKCSQKPSTVKFIC